MGAIPTHGVYTLWRNPGRWSRMTFGNPCHSRRAHFANPNQEGWFIESTLLDRKRKPSVISPLIRRSF